MTKDKQFYFVHIQSLVEPLLKGPFDSEDRRDDEAKEYRRTSEDYEDCDVIFWMDVNENGVPEIGSYSGAFFDEDGEES